MSATKLFQALLIALLVFTVLPMARFNRLELEPVYPTRSGVAVALAQTPPGQKLLVAAEAEATLKQLAAGGAVRLGDYDTFSLWRVTAGQVKALSNRASLAVRPDFETIPLRGGQVINTASGGEPSIPNRLRQTPGQEPEFGLVQFVGPIKDEWLAELVKAGLEVVIYLPHNAYVVWGDAANAILTRLRAEHDFIQWTGPYHPAYRLEPALQQIAAGRADEWVEVTVQFYRTASTPAALARLLQMGGTVRQSPENILDFTNVSLALPAGHLVEVATWPEVFNVEPWVAPEPLDEIQNQLVAGNVISASGVISPSAPGYLAWLAAKGFPTTTTSYPVVDVVDDGIDQGNANNVLEPDFHELGSLANPDRVMYLANCTTDAAANGTGGHGHLNMGIVGSYNNLAGSPHVDAAGYRRGLGVSPYGRLAGSKIFRNSGPFDTSACGGNDQGVVASSFLKGADFTSNSWGRTNGGAYDTSAQAYDALTRDAFGPTAGNQEMLHIFAAGNSGPIPGLIDSPGVAKNVITVGATENVRDEGVADGNQCQETSGDNADDIGSFSSRGPLADNRVKPELMAPGVHIQGPASKDPGFAGGSVCGGPTNNGLPPAADAYYPASQTRYTWSSGTSHATPAVAGAASLAWEYYGRVLNPGQTPSPAMLKALLINSSRYLNGSGTGGVLPSNDQGWGGVNLGRLTNGLPRYLLDQSFTFNRTGQVYTATGQVISSTQPFRVSLVWTDAPGPTVGNAYVNDLDLEVMVGGQTYRGNVFNGANSTTGGAADFRNNVENVFLPAGVNGPYTVRVLARNIAGDGWPGNGDLTDQDFALVIYNGTHLLQTVMAVTEVQARETGAGNNNGAIEPGEVIRLDIGLTNYGDLAATGVSGVVATLGGQVTMINQASPYANVPFAAVVTNTIPYTFVVSPAQICGQPAPFVFTATHNTGRLSHNFSLPTGRLVPNPTVPFANPASITIPSSGSGSPYPSTITVAGVTDPVVTVTVTLTNINHTFVDDIDILLVGPGGQNVLLMSDVGSSSTITNVTLTFTDGAGPLPVNDSFTSGIFAPTNLDADDLFAGPAPTGPYGERLAVFDGVDPNGTWSLYVRDDAIGDKGNINGGWGLAVTTARPVCAAALGADLAVRKSDLPDPVGSGALLTYTLSLSNAGPQVAAAVVVTDKLPPALTLRGVSGPGWSCNQGGWGGPARFRRWL